MQVGGPAQTTNNCRIHIVGAQNAALSMHVDHTHVDHGSSCRSVTQFWDRANPYVPNPTIEEHVQPRFNGGKYRSRDWPQGSYDDLGVDLVYNLLLLAHVVD